MNRMFAFFTTSTAILAIFIPLALARDPSPPGGGYLEFNGKDNYAILENGKLVDTEFEAFTVEAWIYLRDSPEIEERCGIPERWIIAAKQGCFELSVTGFDDDAPFKYSVKIYKQPPDMRNVSEVGKEGHADELNKWHHISGSFDGSVVNRLSFDGSIQSGGAFARPLANTALPFYIGGMELLGSFFDGFIDEVRISNVERYKNDFEPPKRPFEVDKNTVALWHFDKGFTDSSGNGNTLIGKGVVRFSVEPAGKLSTTWAEIKK